MNVGVPWQRKTRFGIQDKMADVIRKTIDACRSEQSSIRRRLKKLQYGR